MRFTYLQDTASPRAAEPRSRLHHLLTVVLIGLAGLAAFELITFTIDYIDALRG